METVRIAITGPESSGKTALCEALMHHFGGGMVAEGARDHLAALGRPYDEADVLRMARDQARAHLGARRAGPVFMDTDTVNFAIWSREKYGRVHPGIERLVGEVAYDMRLLCRPDIPWEPDPFRENPHDRDRLFGLWVRELEGRGLPFTLIGGDRERRMGAAVKAVEGMMAGRRR